MIGQDSKLVLSDEEAEDIVSNRIFLSVLDFGVMTDQDYKIVKGAFEKAKAEKPILDFYHIPWWY